MSSAHQVPTADPRAVRPPLGRPILIGWGMLCALALLLWPWLPPVHQDEYLPLLPVSWFIKTPAARSSMLLGYSIRVFGHGVPARSYPYVGSLKGLLYAATWLPASVPVYRATNLVLVGVLFSLVLWASWRLSRGSRAAVMLCLAFLISDTSLIVLGITDEGPIVLCLILATLFLGLLTSLIEAPRWWKVLPIALIVCLGVWDRLNFGWFVVAGLAGCAAASLARPLRGAAGLLVVSVVGCAIGLAALVHFLPEYLSAASRGVDKSISIRDPARLWKHWVMLVNLVDPFAAYHRYININSGGRRLPYVAYRWAFSLLVLAVIAASLAVGAWHLGPRRHRAGRFLFLGAFLASLLFAIVKTVDAWSSHHIVFVKPFVFIALVCLVGELSRLRTLLAGLSVLLAIGFGWVGIRGLADMQSAPPIGGIYDVSWNGVDAWQAAARSTVRTVYALDWGVFYPGVVNSPADQRWEMREVKSLEELWSLNFGRKSAPMGLLFRSSGGNHWLLGASNDGQNYTVEEKQVFRRHKGEEWVFLVVSTAGRERILATAGDPSANLVRNPAFREGEAYWQSEKWEETPGAAELTIGPCDAGDDACARLTHHRPADSRLVQTITLAPNTTYEVSAQAKADGVDEAQKGAHLCLMEGSAESADLRGDTAWHRLRFYLTNRNTPRPVRLAVRLGTFGSVTTGTAWFTHIVVRQVPAPEEGARVYDLGAPR